MPNINTTQTRNYKFGVESADAPSLGMAVVNSAELKYEPEVYVKAQDGEGHTISLARTPPKIVGTFVGYVTSPDFSAPFSFSFLGITFVVKSSTRARKKGEFMEVTVEADGYAGLPA
jgi:hypothetical protein